MSTELRAFSADQVSRITGASERQLSYWDATGLFSPQFGAQSRRSPHSRVYSYRDLVGLRVLAMLRNQYRVPLQTLREVDAWLRRHYDTPWSELTFWLAGRKVLFEHPETGTPVAVPPGQSALPIELQKIAREVDREISKTRRRAREDIGRIVRNRHVQHNAWVLAGTRIPTWSIREYHEAGYATNAILRQFPALTKADVEAALAHERELQQQAS